MGSLALWMMAMCSAHANISIPPIHRLQDIQNAAERFVQAENARQKTAFTADRANSKIIVVQCAVQLRSSWARPSDQQSRKSVQIACPYGVRGEKGWRVFVPVIKPTSSGK